MLCKGQNGFQVHRRNNDLVDHDSDSNNLNSYNKITWQASEASSGDRKTVDICASDKRHDNANNKEDGCDGEDSNKAVIKNSKASDAVVLAAGNKGKRKVQEGAPAAAGRRGGGKRSKKVEGDGDGDGDEHDLGECEKDVKEVGWNERR